MNRARYVAYGCVLIGASVLVGAMTTSRPPMQFSHFRGAYQSSRVYGTIDLVTLQPVDWPLSKDEWANLQSAAQRDVNGGANPELMLTAITPLADGADK